jgi:hypothetical protein
MIPLIIGAFGVGMLTLDVMSTAATAGSGYALGRKYGRKICEVLDQGESILISSVDKFRN